MERLGRYHLAGEIAASDFVTIHRAYLVTGGGVARPVAVKKIVPAFAKDVETISLLVEEARITAQLEHAGILGLVDLDQVDGAWFLATERVLGRQLNFVVAKAKERGVAIDPQCAAYITIQILNGLAHAHERTDARGDLLGIVHRDVCPANVLLAYSGEVKVTNFAYSKIRGRPGGTHPRIEPRYGYMSPEQALGSDVDHRADVFGAGLIAYELLTGRAAYETRSVHETLLAAQRGRLAPISELASQVPVELATVVDKALAFDRRGRHASAAVFRDELSRVVYQKDPTYGAHRLMSFMLRVLGDEAFDDRLTEATERAELESEVGAPAAGRAGSVRRAPPSSAQNASQLGSTIPNTIPSPASNSPLSTAPGSLGTPSGPSATGVLRAASMLAASTPPPPPPPSTPSVPPMLAQSEAALSALASLGMIPRDAARPNASSSSSFELRSQSSPPPVDHLGEPQPLRTITDTRFAPEVEGPKEHRGPPPPPQPNTDSVPRLVGTPLAAPPPPSPSKVSSDPLALALGHLAPGPAAAPPMLPPVVSSFGNAMTTIAPEAMPPLAFERKRLPLGKIVLGLVAAGVIGLAAFSFSSPSRYRVVERKLRAAFIGRHGGGLLTIESLPPGARVTIDDEPSGRKTPLTVENLESEVVHDVRLELDEEKPVTSTVAIRAGEKRTLTLMFPDAVVTLSVVTDPPGAELWLDNKSVALTPASLMLRVGKEVNVRLTRVGYVEHVETLVPEKQKQINISFTMEKTQALLDQEAAEAEALKAAEQEAAGAVEEEAAAEEPQEKVKPKKKRR